jgi:uncharacterized metal-binding protein/predicted Fe-Mo cluster-binding NifX family protein
MIYGIPLFRNRVAPRYTIADSILIVKVSMNRIVNKTVLKINIDSWNELLKIFSDNKVDTLVCGGINYESKKLSAEQGISVIDNVSCSEDEVIEAIRRRILEPGFGFSMNSDFELKLPERITSKKNIELPDNVDCINCRDYKCLEGKACELSLQMNPDIESNAIKEILSSALDISFENERVLCRLSELIYFAIEMNYKKIGIAYCTELSEPAGIVTQVLRRFFHVYPVCCKIGGKQLSDSMQTGNKKIECNPAGQANALNMSGVDFNIIIGLCIGTDCIFTELSDAPVSTLFVKDKSLANNPIGAVYSDYYLKEAANASIT